MLALKKPVPKLLFDMLGGNLAQLEQAVARDKILHKSLSSVAVPTGWGIISIGQLNPISHVPYTGSGSGLMRDVRPLVLTRELGLGSFGG